jgi:hypothetical protein
MGIHSHGLMRTIVGYQHPIGLFFLGLALAFPSGSFFGLLAQENSPRLRGDFLLSCPLLGDAPGAPGPACSPSFSTLSIDRASSSVPAAAAIDLGGEAAAAADDTAVADDCTMWARCRSAAEAWSAGPAHTANLDMSHIWAAASTSAAGFSSGESGSRLTRRPVARATSAALVWSLDRAASEIPVPRMPVCRSSHMNREIWPLSHSNDESPPHRSTLAFRAAGSDMQLTSPIAKPPIVADSVNGWHFQDSRTRPAFFEPFNLRVTQTSQHIRLQQQQRHSRCAPMMRVQCADRTDRPPRR